MEIIETTVQPVSIWDKGKLFLKSVIIFVMALALWLPINLANPYPAKNAWFCKDGNFCSCPL